MAEVSGEELSREELRKQLFTSLRSTGILDSLKSQLRARLLEHLRGHNGDLVEPKNKRGKPSLTERLLSSLFLEYLESNGFTFTISVFLPESHMVSWPPFSYDEMLELLHLDPSSDLHLRLKLAGGERQGCLAHQLVMVLQQMPVRSGIQEVSTQTSQPAACAQPTQTLCTSPMNLERSMKEVDDAYMRKKEAHDAQRMLPYRSLEDRITILHQEFDARVNAEVAMQVSRIREYEISAARMDEAARYRRQLARDREELEEIHKSRMDRIKSREESLLERLLAKEKAIEASAYEQRQKTLAEITSLRDREDKLRQFKESQERREEKLDERELSLKAKEEEVVRVRQTLYAQADEFAASRRKELEEQYRELRDRLHHDRTLLEAEREQMKEERMAVAIEIAASRGDKELIHALHHRLSIEEDQRLTFMKTIKELEEKVRHHSSEAPKLADVCAALKMSKAELEQERLQRHANEKEIQSLKHKLQLKEKKLQIIEAEKEKWTARHKKLLMTIDQLETLVKDAQVEKVHAAHDLEVLQVQLRTNESELLETATRLRKAQQALGMERLQHCALRSRMNTLVPSIRTEVEGLAPQHGDDPRGKYEHKTTDRTSCTDVSLKEKWASLDCFNKEPKPEGHEVWSQLPSKAIATKDPLVHQSPSTTLSKAFSAGPSIQFPKLHDDVETSANMPDLEPHWSQTPGWQLIPSPRSKDPSPNKRSGISLSPPREKISSPPTGEPESDTLSAANTCQRTISGETVRPNLSSMQELEMPSVWDLSGSHGTANIDETHGDRGAKEEELCQSSTESLGSSWSPRGCGGHQPQGQNPSVERLWVDGHDEEMPLPPDMQDNLARSETTQTDDKVLKSELNATRGGGGGQRIEILITKKCGPVQVDLPPGSELITTVGSLMCTETASETKDVAGFPELSPRHVVDFKSLQDLGCEPTKKMDVQSGEKDDQSITIFEAFEKDETNRAHALEKTREGEAKPEGGSESVKPLAWESGLWDLRVARDVVKLTELEKEAVDITHHYDRVTTKEEQAVADGAPLIAAQLLALDDIDAVVHELEEDDPGFFVDEVDPVVCAAEEKQAKHPHAIQEASPRKPLSPRKVNQEHQILPKSPEGSCWGAASRKAVGMLPELSDMLDTNETSLREKINHGRRCGHAVPESEGEPHQALPKTLHGVEGDRNLTAADIAFNACEQSLKFFGDDRRTHETSQTAIAPKNQEILKEKKQGGKEGGGPIPVDQVGTQSGHKNWPTLALAIRNNQLVKVGMEDGRQSDVQAKPGSRPPRHDAGPGEEIPEMVPQTGGLARDPHSGSEDSTYRAESFEEEVEGEEGEDAAAAYSEESCTNSALRAPSVRPSGTHDRDPASSPRSARSGKEGSTDLGKGSTGLGTSASTCKEEAAVEWGVQSEQGSYSPSEDATAAGDGGGAPWLEDCGTSMRMMMHVDGDPLDFGDVFSAPASDTSKSSGSKRW